MGSDGSRDSNRVATCLHISVLGFFKIRIIQFSYFHAHREEQRKIFPDFRNIPRYLEELIYYDNNVIMCPVDNKT